MFVELYFRFWEGTLGVRLRRKRPPHNSRILIYVYFQRNEAVHFVHALCFSTVSTIPIYKDVELSYPPQAGTTSSVIFKQSGVSGLASDPNTSPSPE